MVYYYLLLLCRGADGGVGTSLTGVWRDKFWVSLESRWHTSTVGHQRAVSFRWMEPLRQRRRADGRCQSSSWARRALAPWMTAVPVSGLLRPVFFWRLH